MRIQSIKTIQAFLSAICLHAVLGGYLFYEITWQRHLFQPPQASINSYVTTLARIEKKPRITPIVKRLELKKQPIKPIKHGIYKRKENRHQQRQQTTDKKSSLSARASKKAIKNKILVFLHDILKRELHAYLGADDWLAGKHIQVAFYIDNKGRLQDIVLLKKLALRSMNQQIKQVLENIKIQKYLSQLVGKRYRVHIDF